MSAPGGTRATVGIIAQVSLIAFEALGVATAMPVVAEDLDAVRSYALAFSLFLTTSLLGTVLAGGWADVRGPRTPVAVGLALFCGGLVLCGVAPTFAVLLAGRAVSGLGAGAMVVALYVVIARCYPDDERPRVFAWVSAAWVLPSVLGPPVAGWLATDVTWRAVFLVVPPLILVATAALWPVLGSLGPQEGGPHREGGPRRDGGPGGDGGPAAAATRRRRAALGVLVAGGALVLQWGGQSGGAGPLVAVAVVTGLVALGVAVPRLLPRGTLRAHRGLPSVIAARGLLTAAFFAAETFVPLMLVRERGLPPAVAGLILTAAALGWAAGAWLQGRPRLPLGRTALLALGGGVLALGIGAVPVALLPAVPPLVLVPLWAVAGVGMGLGMSVSSVLTLALSAPGEEGSSSAALQLSDALGSVLGIAAAGAVFAALHTRDGADAGVYLLIWAGCAVLGVVAALVGRRAHPPAAAAGATAAVTLGTP